MTKEEKNKLEEQDIFDEMEEELVEIEDKEGNIDEKKLDDIIKGKEKMVYEEEINKEEEKCNDILARTMADFDNFKKRTERNKGNMIFFLKQDIFKKILPRIDDINRIIDNTPDDLQKNPLFEGIVSMKTKLLDDLSKMGVKSFNVKGEEVNPDIHDVMTTVPGKENGIIFDEFEKGYMLDDRVLRHARVIVGAGD